MLVLDACIVVTFANAGHFSLIEELGQHKVSIAHGAVTEVTRDPTKSVLQRLAGLLERSTC
jgi:hypothetical protein